MAMVIPGTLRSASPRVVVAWLFMVAESMTVTACGVSCRLSLGMVLTGGAWFSPFLSAWSLTETGPSCTGWAVAGAASSSAPSEAHAPVLKGEKADIGSLKVQRFGPGWHP